jgi:hypothetical protein
MDRFRFRFPAHSAHGKSTIEFPLDPTIPPNAPGWLDTRRYAYTGGLDCDATDSCQENLPLRRARSRPPAAGNGFEGANESGLILPPARKQGKWAMLAMSLALSDTNYF